MAYNNYGFEEEPKKKPPIGPIIATIVTAISAIIVAYVTYVLPNKISVQSTQTAEARQTFIVSPIAGIETPTFSPTTPRTQAKTGRLEGILTDREGNPISDMSVSISNGPATKTDIEGKFILNNVTEGDQIIVVKPPSGEGQFTLNFPVVADQINNVNIVYDTTTSRLGLLSIVAPIDGGDLEISQDNVDNNGTPIIVHRATIYGRCDGLGQIFVNGFDVWVLVSSWRDGKYWVQFPAATVDPHNNTWRANIVLGDAQHPPVNGEMWTIIAVATAPDSGFDRIDATPKLSLLPPHVTSNVITVIAQIK